MPNTQRISEMTTAAVLNDSDMMEISQADETAQSGYSTKKTTIVSMANKIAKAVQFAELQTTSKNIVGAINEAAQSGGGGSDVEVTPILTEGTKIATITVDEVDTDIYGENTKEELGKLSTEKTTTGNPVTFETINGGMAKSCEVTMNPIQDLNGYEYPWVGGAGKNKLQVTATSQTINGVTFTVNDDGSIGLNGTATAYTEFIANASNLLKAGSYIVNGVIDGSGTTKRIRIRAGSAVIATDTGAGAEFTLSEDTAISAELTVSNGVSLTNATWYPMIRLSTESDASFAPYSNICPISGRDSVDVVVTGANQWDEEWELGYINTSTGQNAQSNQQIRAKNYIPCFSDANYYFLADYESTNRGMWTIFYDENKDIVTTDLPTGKSQSGYARFLLGANKTPATAKYMRFYMVAAYGTSYGNNISVNYPSTDTEYHAYNGQTKTIIFPSTVYGGTDEIVGGVGTEIWSDKILLSSLTWQKYTNSSVYGTLYFTNSLQSLLTDTTDVNKIYTCFEIFNSVTNYNHDGGAGGDKELPDNSARVNASKIVYVRCESCQTLEDFETLIATHDMCYIKATPTTFSTTPTPIPLNKGTNVISTDADDMELTYSEMMDIDDVKALISEAIGTVLNTEF